MRLVFDPAFDSGAWPGPLGGGERAAVSGEAWVGPLGMLGELELRLGLGGPGVTRAERVGSLLGPVRRLDGFWSRSAEGDPVSTAKALLRWRDILWRAGWRGEALAPRLEALARVTAEVPPGVADRLAKVLAELDSRRPGDIESVALFEDPDELPRPWPEILRRLGSRGIRIDVRDLPGSTARGDLCHYVSGSGPFEPTGDGSLQLLRAHGPMACAEEVAARLAASAGASGDLAGTVIVTPDPTLDAALHRHGLPTTGAREEAGADACFQILPLLLDLGWDPPDPAAVHGFLGLPLSPVPRGVALRLARALLRQPAVGSPRWRQALEEGLDAIPDETRRRDVAMRLDAVFRTAVPAGAPYPWAEARRRADLLVAWADRYLAVTDDPAAGSALLAARAHVDLFRGLLAGYGETALKRPTLRRLVELASAGLPTPPPFPARAGLAAVADPAALVGPARRLVWWNFTLHEAPRLEEIPLTSAERSALEGRGIHLPSPAVEAERTAERWQRPLRAAGESLLLVAPTVDRAGEESFPHPLWDEIEARLPDDQLRDRIVVSRPVGDPAPPTERLELLPAPRPLPEWRVPANLLSRRERESPSSLQSLVSCSFQWACRYGADLEAGLSSSLPSGALLLGNVAHALFEEVLTDPLPSPEEARRSARAHFDEIVPRLAAVLLQPGSTSERDALRETLAEAAATLCAQLHESGHHVVARETFREKPAFGAALGGRLDLLLGPEPAVVDLKWGGSRSKRESLENGTALQLAAYSHLASEGDDALAPVAYFLVAESLLLSTDAATFPGARAVAGRSPRESWAAARRAVERAFDSLGRGELRAPWSRERDDKDRSCIDGEGRLDLVPLCRYCDYAALCGRDLEVAP